MLLAVKLREIVAVAVMLVEGVPAAEVLGSPVPVALPLGLGGAPVPVLLPVALALLLVDAVAEAVTLVLSAGADAVEDALTALLLDAVPDEVTDAAAEPLCVPLIDRSETEGVLLLLPVAAGELDAELLLKGVPLALAVALELHDADAVTEPVELTVAVSLLSCSTRSALLRFASHPAIARYVNI